MTTSFSDAERADLLQQLRDYLGALIPVALQDESVIEISVNHDGVLRIAHIGGRVEVTGEQWPEWRIEGLLGVIATLQGVVVRRSHPVLESWIPGYGARIEGVVRPVVQHPIFSIRRPSSRIFTLEDYVRSERLSTAARLSLVEAIRERLNVLVVGGTGSGKTTLVNALLHEINSQFPGLRVGILEDTRELIAMSPAWFQLQTMHAERGAAEVDLDHLLRVALRLYPARIVVGELRGAETMGFLRAANSGHPGMLATVHANSAEAGLLRLEQLGAYATGRPIPREEIAVAVQMVVFVQHGHHGPCVRSIVRVRGFTPSGYEIEEVAA